MRHERIETRRSIVPPLSAILVCLLILLAVLVNRPDSAEQIVRDTMRTYGIPGAILAYGKAGEQPTVKAFGNLKADQVVPIASLSKPITSEVVMALVDQGRLRLDRHIVQLLQHEGGYDRTINPVDDCMPSPPDFAPGTRSAYSNKNYCELGSIIESDTGLSYEAAAKSALPLNGFRIAVPRFGAAGGWAARASDLFRFYSRLPHPSNEPFVRPSDYIPAYRLGWIRFDQGWGHWGSLLPPILQTGQMSIALHRDDGIVILVIFNRRPENYKTLLPDLTRKLEAVT